MFHKLLIVGLGIISIGVLLHLTGCHHKMFMHHCKKHHKDMPNKILKKITKECDLSETQKAKLVALKEVFIGEHKSMFKQHHLKFDVMLTEIEKEKLDQEQFSQVFEEGLQKKQEVHKKLVEKFAEFHASLTPEQKLKLTDLIRKHHDKMVKHFEYEK